MPGVARNCLELPGVASRNGVGINHLRLFGVSWLCKSRFLFENMKSQINNISGINVLEQALTLLDKHVFEQIVASKRILCQMDFLAIWLGGRRGGFR